MCARVFVSGLGWLGVSVPRKRGRASMLLTESCRSTLQYGWLAVCARLHVVPDRGRDQQRRGDHFGPDRVHKEQQTVCMYTRYTVCTSMIPFFSLSLGEFF